MLLAPDVFGLATAEALRRKGYTGPLTIGLAGRASQPPAIPPN